jgi:hypothetical protein
MHGIAEVGSAVLEGTVPNGREEERKKQLLICGRFA